PGLSASCGRGCRGDESCNGGSEALRRRSTISHSRVHACPLFRLGLSLSSNGRRSRDRPQRMVGNSPAVAALPPLHEILSLPDHAPAPAPWNRLRCEFYHLLIASPALCGGGTGRGRLAGDRPDEACELTRHRGDGDGLEPALAEQRSVAPVETALRLPGDLANRS